MNSDVCYKFTLVFVDGSKSRVSVGVPASEMQTILVNDTDINFGTDIVEDEQGKEVVGIDIKDPFGNAYYASLDQSRSVTSVDSVRVQKGQLSIPTAGNKAAPVIGGISAAVKMERAIEF